MALKLQNKRFYPHLFIGVAALLTILTAVLDDKLRSELLLPLGGAFAGFIYFLYRQHLDETKLLKELFVEFNAHYDERNERLNQIKDAPKAKQLEPDERKTLFDYFNLCSEEETRDLTVTIQWGTGGNRANGGALTSRNHVPARRILPTKW